MIGCSRSRGRASRPIQFIKTTGLVAAFSALAPNTAWALMQWNNGREQVFLDLEAGAVWDSNIGSSAAGESDFITQATAGLEYQRRAGLIALDASAAIASGVFADNHDENYVNPSAHLELTKDSGRSTGAILVSSSRESRADTAANVRTESWVHAASVNVKYPVIERYSLSGRFDYSKRDFVDNSALVDFESFAAGADIFYVYTSARDLVGGYLVRSSRTGSGSRYTDHAFTAGISGRILPKVSGAIRSGYQMREPHGPEDSHSSWTASGSATWTANSRLIVTAQIAKDFSLTSTDLSVDTVATALDAQFTVNSRISIFAGVTYSRSDFLGMSGGDRDDVNAGANAGISRRLGSRLTANLTWSYSKNWSTVSFSDFDRQSVGLTLSTRL